MPRAVFRDGRLLKYDKRQPTAEMTHIDYGVALLRGQALERISPDRPSDLADLYVDLVAEGRMIGYEVTQRFYEIGSPAGLEETRAYLEATLSRGRRNWLASRPSASAMTPMAYATEGWRGALASIFVSSCSASA